MFSSRRTWIAHRPDERLFSARPLICKWSRVEVALKEEQRQCYWMRGRAAIAKVAEGRLIDSTELRN